MGGPTAVDGNGISVTRATGVNSAGLLFYYGNKFVNVDEDDFFYLGGVFFDEGENAESGHYQPTIVYK